MNDFDRNYAAILELVADTDARFAAVKFPELAELRDSAEANLVRLVALMLLPACAAKSGGEEQVLVAKVITSVTGNRPYVTAAEWQAVTDELQNLRERARTGDFQFVYVGEQAADPLAAVIKWYSATLDNTNELLRQGMDVLFASAIIMAYTMLEALSDDLWVKAVNLRPKTLAANVLATKASKADDDQQPVIALSELRDFDFDLRDKMGTLLKRTKRVSLDSILAVKSAYHDAFWNPESPSKRRPCVALTAIFDGHLRDIFALESIRNILVHQGGKIDDKFIKAMKGHTEFGEFTVGAKLLLSGHGVVHYVKSALNFSKALLSFVDGWLVKYHE